MKIWKTQIKKTDDDFINKWIIDELIAQLNC